MFHIIGVGIGVYLVIGVIISFFCSMTSLDYNNKTKLYKFIEFFAILSAWFFIIIIFLIDDYQLKKSSMRSRPTIMDDILSEYYV